MFVIRLLEFEYASYDVAIQLVNHYTTVIQFSIQLVLEFCILITYYTQIRFWVFLWHINVCRLFNAKDILTEEQFWYYLTHSWEDKAIFVSASNLTEIDTRSFFIEGVLEKRRSGTSRVSYPSWFMLVIGLLRAMWTKWDCWSWTY